MRAALLVFLALAVVLLGMVARAGKWAAFGAALGTQERGLVPLLVLAVVLAACVEVLLSPAQISTWMGDGAGWRGVMLGWVAGALTPGGGPIGLPLAAALARRGAALPAVITYLTSMSLMSLIRLPMEWGILGPRITATRWAATALLPPLVGGCVWMVQRFFG
jgi:uncharacterized membrane protein YraQ (UPF0718 family)